MNTAMALAAIALCIWFWIDTMRVREYANAIARRSCQKIDVQFLDGTVSFASLKPTVSPNGLRFRRVFTFDYSENGENRKEGFLVFIGNRVTDVGFQAREIH